MSMFQRKVPQTLVYGVKQAIVRSQQQTKNAADGSDLLAMNNTVQQASSTTTTTTTTTTNPTTTVVTSSTTTSTPSSIIDGVSSDHMNSTTAIIAPTSSSSPSSSSAAAVIGSGSVSSVSGSGGGAANVKIFINEVSNHGTVQLSNHFTIDAIANVSDAIVKAVGIDKLMEIASANLELPTIMLEEEEFITNYGSLDFSQEEFDMFTSSSLSLSHQLQYQSSVVVPVTSHTFSSSKSPPTAATAATAATATSMDKQKSKIDASKMVSSKNSTVQFEDVTHNNHHVTTRRSALMSALTERIMSKFHQLISQLRQLLSWNSSMSTTTNSTSSSNNNSNKSSSSSPLLNHNGSGDSNEHQMRVRELTTLGVAFAAAYAIDVLLFRMMRNPLMSHAFRNSLMNTLKQV